MGFICIPRCDSLVWFPCNRVLVTSFFCRIQVFCSREKYFRHKLLFVVFPINVVIKTEVRLRFLRPVSRTLLWRSFFRRHICRPLLMVHGDKRCTMSRMLRPPSLCVIFSPFRGPLFFVLPSFPPWTSFPSLD